MSSSSLKLGAFMAMTSTSFTFVLLMYLKHEQQHGSACATTVTCVNDSSSSHAPSSIQCVDRRGQTAASLPIKASTSRLKPWPGVPHHGTSLCDMSTYQGAKCSAPIYPVVFSWIQQAQVRICRLTQRRPLRHSYCRKSGTGIGTSAVPAIVCLSIHG